MSPKLAKHNNMEDKQQLLLKLFIFNISVFTHQLSSKTKNTRPITILKHCDLYISFECSVEIASLVCSDDPHLLCSFYRLYSFGISSEMCGCDHLVSSRGLTTLHLIISYVIPTLHAVSSHKAAPVTDNLQKRNQ